MTDPWDWYIYLHEWLIFMVNVGKYTSPMDPMGRDHLKQENNLKPEASIFLMVVTIG